MKIELRREETCVRALAWRCDVPPEIPWPELMCRLERAGFVRQPRLGALERMLSAEGHELLFVTSSGRVQLRVHYTTPAEARRHVAERLLVGLVRTMSTLASAPP